MIYICMHACMIQIIYNIFSCAHVYANICCWFKFSFAIFFYMTILPRCQCWFHKRTCDEKIFHLRETKDTSNTTQKHTLRTRRKRRRKQKSQRNVGLSLSQDLRQVLTSAMAKRKRRRKRMNRNKNVSRRSLKRRLKRSGKGLPSRTRPEPLCHVIGRKYWAHLNMRVMKCSFTHQWNDIQFVFTDLVD